MEAKDIKVGMNLYATIEESGYKYKTWVRVLKPDNQNIKVMQLSTGDAFGELFVEHLHVSEGNWDDTWQIFKPIPSMHSFFRHLFKEVDSVMIDGEP